MGRAVYRVSFAWILGLMLSAPHQAYAADVYKISDPSLCLDGMETVPFQDDLMPTEISVDGGCMLPQTPISA
jgi:hypothetical protein